MKKYNLLIIILIIRCISFSQTLTLQPKILLDNNTDTLFAFKKAQYSFIAKIYVKKLFCDSTTDIQSVIISDQADAIDNLRKQNENLTQKSVNDKIIIQDLEFYNKALSSSNEQLRKEIKKQKIQKKICLISFPIVFVSEALGIIYITK